ncbi:MAG: heme o synthase [Parachlamydiaceae bacterium]
MAKYYLLLKPGIILGNLITVAAGFLLASKGSFDFLLFINTLLGLGFVIGSACVFNNLIDRELDQKMKRTKDRLLARGLIAPFQAAIFACLLCMVGLLILLLSTNLLTVFLAMIGFVVYVFLYSLWKSRTIYGTAIGSISGAVPPVVGYCAVSNSFDLGALILFAMLVLWQMPHFFAIALSHFDDYTAAKIPVLPVMKGMWRTKVHMLIYIIFFIIAALLLTFFKYTGYVYLMSTLVVGSIWLMFAIVGFKSKNDQLWGHHMFCLSLVMIVTVCLLIPIDVLRY